MTFFESLWRALNTRDIKTKLKADHKGERKYPTLLAFLTIFSGQSQMWDKANQIFLDMATSKGIQSYSIRMALDRMFGGEVPGRNSRGELRSQYFELDAFCARIRGFLGDAQTLTNMSQELSLLAQENPSLAPMLSQSINQSYFFQSFCKGYDWDYSDQFAKAGDITFAQAAELITSLHAKRKEEVLAKRKEEKEAAQQLLIRETNFRTGCENLQRQFKTLASQHGLGFNQALKIFAEEATRLSR